LEEPESKLHPRLAAVSCAMRCSRLAFPSDFGIQTRALSRVVVNRFALSCSILFKDHPEQVIIAEKPKRRPDVYQELERG